MDCFLVPFLEYFGYQSEEPYFWVVTRKLFNWSKDQVHKSPVLIRIKKLVEWLKVDYFLSIGDDFLTILSGVEGGDEGGGVEGGDEGGDEGGSSDSSKTEASNLKSSWRW